MSFFCKDCGKKFYPENECTCLGQPKVTPYIPEQDLKPAEIPLIELPEEYAGTVRIHMMNGANRQRDADMAWFQKHCKACADMGVFMELPEAHDQQVAAKAVKEFAERIITHRQKWVLTDDCIRAMAEDEEC